VRCLSEDDTALLTAIHHLIPLFVMHYLSLIPERHINASHFEVAITIKLRIDSLCLCIYFSMIK
jgi:hypothetical protein